MGKKSFYFVLTFVFTFLVLFNLSCWDDKVTTPEDNNITDSTDNDTTNDSTDKGDYKFDLDTLYKKVTVFQLKELDIQFKQGADSFVSIIPDVNVISFLDTSNFYAPGDSAISIIPVANGFDTITVNCIVDAIAPDSSIYSSSAILTIVNGVKIIKSSDTTSGYKVVHYKISNVDSAVDSSYKVNWILPDTTLILSGDDSLTIALKDTSAFNVQAVLQDKYGNVADTVSSLFSQNWTKPTIEIIDSSVFDTLLIDSANLKLKVKSNYGISDVSILIGDSVYSASMLNDSLWSYTVKNLVSKEIVQLKAVVLDSFNFTDTISFSLYHDATKEDTNGPNIFQISGTADGERLTTSSDTLLFEIKDPFDVDSVSCYLNDTALVEISMISQDTYSVILILNKYGNNKLTIFASDNSTNDNSSSKSISINYNTIPSGFSIVAPENEAIGIENIGGVALSWNPSNDADGDSLFYYRVFYGTSLSSMLSKDVIDTFCNISISGDETAYWYVEVAHGIDTLRYPSVSTQYYSFSTINHDATFTQLPQTKKITINDTLTLNVAADDPENIVRYDWSVSSGASIAVTTLGTAKYISNSTPGHDTINITAVDEKGGKTSIMLVDTVINDKPSISFSDTTVSLINETIQIAPIIVDKGTRKTISFNILNSSYVNFSGDTNIVLPDTGLPYNSDLYIKVIDEDGNEVTDTFLIQKDYDTTMLSAPGIRIEQKNGIYYSYPDSLQHIQGFFMGYCTSTNGIDWSDTILINPDTLNDSGNMVFGAVSIRSICDGGNGYYYALGIPKNKFPPTDYRGVYKSEDGIFWDSVASLWAGLQENPSMVAFDASHFGSPSKEFAIFGGTYKSGAAYWYSNDSIYYTAHLGNPQRKVALEVPIRTEVPWTFDSSENKMYAVANKGVHYLRTYVNSYNAGSNINSIVETDSKVLPFTHTVKGALYYNSGTFYFADNTGLRISKDGGDTWERTINATWNNGVYWIGIIDNKISISTAENGLIQILGL